MKKPKPIRPGIPLKDIAEETGLSISYISRVLSGDRQPRIMNFAKIARALKMSMDNLYGKLKGFYKE